MMVIVTFYDRKAEVFSGVKRCKTIGKMFKMLFNDGTSETMALVSKLESEAVISISSNGETFYNGLDSCHWSDII